MIKPKTRLALSMLLLPIVLSYSASAQAQGAVTFTLTVKSAFLRSGPSLSAPRIYSIFLGQVYPVTGRNADNSWLQVAFPGATTPTWIMAVFGTVQGDLGSVPVLAEASAPIAQEN